VLGLPLWATIALVQGFLSYAHLILKQGAKVEDRQKNSGGIVEGLKVLKCSQESSQVFKARNVPAIE